MVCLVLIVPAYVAVNLEKFQNSFRHNSRGFNTGCAYEPTIPIRSTVIIVSSFSILIVFIWLHI